MKEFAHVVVWIDHRQARLIEFGHETERSSVVRAHGGAHHLHHKANSTGSGHLREDHKYLQEVSVAMRNAELVLVVGPANEKAELAKHIAHHDPDLHGRILAVETLGQVTEGELRDHAKRFFAVAARMHSQRPDDSHTRR